MPVHVGFQVVQVTGLNEYDIPKELLVTKEWVSEKLAENRTVPFIVARFVRHTAVICTIPAVKTIKQMIY
uniref:UVR domain-containing protein n=1 Tax=Steinernema glaseri TaxID=37863 RepID=A0A1I8A5Z9_9BILA